MVKVVWTGAAGLQFKVDDKTILIDPYYSRVGRIRLAGGRIVPDGKAIERQLDNTDEITSIIVSHTHFDHALDIPYLEGRCSGDIVGSKCLDTLMTLNGLRGRTTICNGGETIRLAEGVSVTMLRSDHGRVVLGKVPYQGEISPLTSLPMKVSDYRVGKVFAPLLKIGDVSFLHIGSAGFVESELRNQSCDVLFLCVAGWNKFSGYPNRVIDMTNPGKIVLFHFDDFFRFHKPGNKTRRLSFLKMEAMKQRIKNRFPDIPLFIPEVSEVVQF